MNMASYGYGGSYPYYQPATAPYYYNYAQHPARGGGGGRSRPPLLLFVLLAALLLLLAASLFARFEAAVESMLHKLRPLLILSPLLLVIAVQLWLATSGDRRGGGGLGHLFSQMTPGQYYRRGAGAYGRWDGGGGGSSPWGVAVVLMLVLMLLMFPPRRRSD